MKAPSASRAHRCSQLMENIIQYFSEKSTVTAVVTATGISLNKRFNEQNNSCARALQLTIRLFALDFYRVIVDEGAARVNYHAIEIESE